MPFSKHELIKEQLRISFSKMVMPYWYQNTVQLIKYIVNLVEKKIMFILSA